MHFDVRASIYAWKCMFFAYFWCLFWCMRKSQACFRIVFSMVFARKFHAFGTVNCKAPSFCMVRSSIILYVWHPSYCCIADGLRLYRRRFAIEQYDVSHTGLISRWSRSLFALALCMKSAEWTPLFFAFDAFPNLLVLMSLVVVGSFRLQRLSPARLGLMDMRRPPRSKGWFLGLSQWPKPGLHSQPYWIPLWALLVDGW